MTIHVVSPGDTLTSVAGAAGISVEKLAADNGLAPTAALAVGQALLILVPAESYTVRAGDTLAAVSRQTGVPLNELWQNNPQLNGGTDLRPGDVLAVRYPDPPQEALTVSGYAYPFIDRTLLRRTLPYLTWLTVFTYGFTPEGELIQPDDAEIVAIAREYGVAPVLLLSTLTDEGTFSNELASALLRDPALQDQLLTRILAVMLEKGYRGMDIDFEYVLPQDADAYARFVQTAADRLRDAGYFTVVSFAPKTSADQPGLLYEAHDYAALGAAADYAFLMTYEWGYTYGPAMAVAPLNKVEQVLSYAVTAVAPDKLLMGIPNYAYDFTLPFVAGESRARSLGNLAAAELAVEKGADILFDPVAKAPFFRYTGEDGAVHEVWFEDARSVDASLSLLRQFVLTGAGYWNIMRWFPQNWLILSRRFRILKTF